MKPTSGTEFLQTQFPLGPEIYQIQPLRIENKDKKKPAPKNPVIKSKTPTDNHLRYIQSILTVNDEALKTKRKTEKALNEDLNLHGASKFNKIPDSKEPIL